VYLIQVHRREGDGVKIGLAIGAAAGLISARVYCRGASEHRDCVRAGSIYLTGSMAAAGALIDHLFKRYTTVFDRLATDNTIRITPVVGARRNGLALTPSPADPTCLLWKKRRLADDVRRETWPDARPWPLRGLPRCRTASTCSAESGRPGPRRSSRAERG